MPYGHLKQYLDLVADAQKKRLQITRSQKQQIAKMYSDIAKEFGDKVSKHNSSTLTYRWIKDYAKSLKNESKTLYKELQGIVEKGITDTAKAVTVAQERFWGGIVPELSGRFRDTLSTVPQSCMEELMSGGVYEDFAGLSERLWNYKKKYDRDISYVINRGIAKQKSAYDLAKDLELYLKPNAKKPWEWRKVYPNCNQVVDYSAQRLSRTSITHAYQMSFVRATKDNPFIEKYKWHSSNGGRTCDLCRQRDGKLFDKDSVKLDHPNGMCIITAVINKSYDEIANELSDWVNGKENSELDKWLLPDEDARTFFKSVFKQNIRKQMTDFDKGLKKLNNPDMLKLLKGAKERVIFAKSYEKGSKYQASSNTIYLSSDATKDVIAHELFHEVDNTYGITQSGMIAESIQKDYMVLAADAKKRGKSIAEMIYSEYKQAFNSKFQKPILNQEYRAISDILNGMSGGEIKLGFRHSDSYWAKPQKLEKEVWAQFGRILYLENEDVIKMTRELFPNVFKDVSGIIERMIK